MYFEVPVLGQRFIGHKESCFPAETFVVTI